MVCGDDTDIVHTRWFWRPGGRVLGGPAAGCVVTDRPLMTNYRLNRMGNTGIVHRYLMIDKLHVHNKQSISKK